MKWCNWETDEFKGCGWHLREIICSTAIVYLRDYGPTVIFLVHSYRSAKMEVWDLFTELDSEVSKNENFNKFWGRKLVQWLIWGLADRFGARNARLSYPPSLPAQNETYKLASRFVKVLCVICKTDLWHRSLKPNSTVTTIYSIRGNIKTCPCAYSRVWEVIFTRNAPLRQEGLCCCHKTQSWPNSICRCNWN